MASWPAVCSTPSDFAARVGLSVGEVALVKLDVEGAEAAILPALVEWLGAGSEGAKPPLFVELHTKFWEGGGGGSASASASAAAAVAGALARYRWVYAARAERPGHVLADNVLQPFDIAAAVAERGGDLCPQSQEFCMVLAVDEVEVPAWVQGLLEVVEKGPVG